MVAPALVILALVSGVPYIDIRKTCRTAQATGVAIDQKAAYNGCVADETEAKQTLIRTWARLSRAYRQSCVEASLSLSPSYVDLLTCLEMRDGGKFTGGVGPNAVPPPATRSGAAPGSTVDPNAAPGTGTPGLPAVPGTATPGLPGVPGTATPELPAVPGSGLPGSPDLPGVGVPGSPGIPGVPGLPPPSPPPGMGTGSGASDVPATPPPGATGSPGTGSK